MLKKLFLFLFFFSLVGAVFSPFFVKAAEENWPLKESQARGILDIIRKEPLSSYQLEGYFSVLAFDSTQFDRQTGAVVLVKQAILAEELSAWFLGGTVQFSKKLLNIFIKLAPVAFGDYSGVLKLIEQYSVQLANRYAMDWFTQNGIKIGTGELSYYFDSYRRKPQKFTATYLITYNPKEKSITAEFYSVSPIEPPLGTGPNALGRNQDNPKTNCWPWDIWVENEKNRNNDGKLEPFIVRVEGKVEEESFSRFKWQAGTTPTVEVIFDKPVPQIEPTDIEVVSPESALRKKLLGPLAEPLEKLETAVGKITKIKEIVEKVISVAKTIFDVFDIGANISGHQDQTENGNAEATPEENLRGVRPLSAQDEVGQVVEQAPAPELELSSGLAPMSALIVKPETVAENPSKVIPAPVVEKAPSPAPVVAPAPAVATPKPVSEAKPAPIVFCKPTTASPLSQKSIILNEIAWMGSKNSANDEWIELKNISSQTINLQGWQIINQKEKLQIALENMSLKPDGFLLLERTDDLSAPTAKADLIFTGGINNTEEALYLFNPSCVLQDTAAANPYWPAGDNSTKKTMERTSSLTWQTSQDVAGTPKKENSPGEAKPMGSGGSGSGGGSSSGSSGTSGSNGNGGASGESSAGQTSATTEEQSPIATSTATTAPDETTSQEPIQVIITEIQIASASSSGDDFIELFNIGAFAADISGYKIKKKSSTGNEYSVKTLAENTTIGAGEYFLWLNSDYNPDSGVEVNATSTQTLASNNSIAFFDQADSVLDQVAWGQGENQFVETAAFADNPEKGTTLSRKYLQDSQTYQDTNNNSEDFEIGAPTPKAKNITLPLADVQAEEDTLPQITTLTAGRSGERGALDLFWLATSSQKYIVRVSQSETNWENAVKIANLTAPEPTREVEKITLQNLEPDKFYYFAVQFVNLLGATSSLSNIAKAKPRKGFLVGGELLTDLENGLSWPKNSETSITDFATSTTQNKALEYVNELNLAGGYAGFSDWRVPNLRELASLLAFTPTSAGPAKELENVRDIYWTSSKEQTSVGYAGADSTFSGWKVNFNTGNMGNDSYGGNNSPLYYFLPVRGPALSDIMPEDDIGLVDNNDNTSSDPKTGLMWAFYNFSQTGENGRKTWQNAVKFALNRALCNDNTFSGNENEPGNCAERGGVKYDDWRLPNVQELVQIVKMGPSLAMPWQSNLSYYYWTATESGENKAWACGDGYLAGKAFVGDKTNYMNVQIVRDSN